MTDSTTEKLSLENLNYFLKILIDEKFDAYHLHSTFNGGRHKDTRSHFVEYFNRLIEILQPHSQTPLDILAVLRLYLKIRIEGPFSIRDDIPFQQISKEKIDATQKKLKEHRKLFAIDFKEFKLSRVRLQFESIYDDKHNVRETKSVNISHNSDEYFEEEFQEHLLLYFKVKEEELIAHLEYLQFERDSPYRRNVIIKLLVACFNDQYNPAHKKGYIFFSELLLELDQDKFHTPDIHAVVLTEVIRGLYKSGLK
jgi:hypothetical protein